VADPKLPSFYPSVSAIDKDGDLKLRLEKERRSCEDIDKPCDIPPTVKMGDVEMENDPDPIKASYDVFIKPRLSSDKQIYVLQFPNRDSGSKYSAKNGAQPFKMRIKPNAGMVEMDVPMDALRNYDREKGIKWGEAMKKSSMSKNGGSHGMPGGFGIGGAQPNGRGRGRGLNVDDEINQQRILEDYENSVRREQVLVKQTLGGQCISNEETTPQYMIGTFRKSKPLSKAPV
jgi:DNA-directed RNA polymerase-3 subunit RPC5